MRIAATPRRCRFRRSGPTSTCTCKKRTVPYAPWAYLRRPAPEIVRQLRGAIYVWQRDGAMVVRHGFHDGGNVAIGACARRRFRGQRRPLDTNSLADWATEPDASGLRRDVIYNFYRHVCGVLHDRQRADADRALEPAAHVVGDDEYENDGDRDEHTGRHLGGQVNTGLPIPAVIVFFSSGLRAYGQTSSPALLVDCSLRSPWH
jgi:hypothetical protein